MTPDLEVLREFPDTGFVPYETEYSRNFSPKHIQVILQADKDKIDPSSIQIQITKEEKDRDSALIRRCTKSHMNLDLTFDTPSEDETFSRFCKCSLRHYPKKNTDARKTNSSFVKFLANSYLNGKASFNGKLRRNGNARFLSVYQNDFRGS